MKLYEIDAEIEKIEQSLDTWAKEHIGDITDFPYETEYDELKGAREDKLLNLGSWHKSLTAESKAFADEIKILQAKKKAVDNKADWVKRFINAYLKVGEKINDTRVQLSWRKSQTVEYNNAFDITKLSGFFKVIEEKVDRAKVKEHLKRGAEFEGIFLQTNNNLQIK